VPKPAPAPAPADSGPTLAQTMQFIQEKLSGQGRVGWAETFSNQPGAIHRHFVLVSDVMADPETCKFYTTYTVDQSVVLPEGKSLSRGGKQLTAEDLQSHTVETDTISFKQVEKITIEKTQDIENQAFVEIAHPEIIATVTPPVFFVKLWASSAVFSVHTSTTEGKQAPVEKDVTKKTIGITIRDEETANKVAKAMTHAMELCGGGVTKKELF
jgi:hypothetical protein